MVDAIGPSTAFYHTCNFRTPLVSFVLQETLKSQGQQVALYEAQLAAQRRETQAAQDTLSEAASEMEAINFEKKQLTLQWKSSLIGMARRDEALQVSSIDCFESRSCRLRSCVVDVCGWFGEVK